MTGKETGWSALLFTLFHLVIPSEGVGFVRESHAESRDLLFSDQSQIPRPAFAASAAGRLGTGETPIPTRA